MSDRVSAAYLALAGELAERAGAIIRRYFRQKIAVEQKPDRTPVTLADREAEKAMREAIEAHYPAHGIWGEEFGRVRPEADYVWVLDPIDGTKSFISGVPLFGTLIVSPSPMWPAALEGSGLDFVFIDTEHNTLDRAQVSWMCQAYARMGLPPLVRIP